MEKDRGFRVLAIIAICIAVVGLTVGYAALQQTLVISTTATAKAGTFVVKFENLSTTPVLTGKAAVKTTASLTTAQVTIDVNLFEPGDSATYTFDVTNSGTIDAKLDTINTTDVVAPVLYSLTYTGGAAPAQNDVLAAGATVHLTLKVTYDPDVTAPVTTDTAASIVTTLLYVQK